MVCFPILIYLINHLIILDVVYSFVNYNKFNRINIFIPKSKNADSSIPNLPDPNFNDKNDLESKNKNIENFVQSDLDYQIDQSQNLKIDNKNQEDSTTIFTAENLTKHIQSFETFIKKIHHCWEFEGLMDEVLKVLKLFTIDDTAECKTKLESQLSGLVDYNNLERKLEGLIIKNYDKFKENMDKLDNIMYNIKKTEPLEFDLLTSSKDLPVINKKPGIINLLYNKLEEKINFIKNKINKIFGKFGITIFNKKHFGSSYKTKCNLNEFLTVPKNFKEKLQTFDSRSIFRNNITFDKKDSWRITFLGTGSRRATSSRGLSSISFQPMGDSGPIWLFDCGEGTRLNLLNLGLSPSKVEKIFITHLHGDHSIGIFSFVTQESKWGKIEIYGPQGIGNMLNSVISAISSSTTQRYTVKEYLNIPFTPLTYENYKSPASGINLETTSGIKPDDNSLYNVMEALNIKITAFPIRHNLPTVGYIIQENLMPNKTAKRRTICLLQDTCDASLASKFVKYPDLLIHESTYSTVTLSGTKKILSEQTNETLSKIERQENLKSCYDSASNLAKDLAYFSRTAAAKKIPTDFVKKLSDMKENQAMFSHGMISKDRIAVIRYQFMLLFNMKTRLTFLENIVQSTAKVEDSIKLLEYVDKFQRDDLEESFADLEEFWRNYIKTTLNQPSYLKSSDDDDVLARIIEDIVWMRGHSTETMAGRLAGSLRAKRLVLTHFSSRIPGDPGVDSLLTVRRIESNASKEMSHAAHNLFVDETDSKKRWQYYKPMVIAAWDGFRIDLPPN